MVVHPVIIGPKTRLGRTLMSQLQEQPDTYAQATIVARDEPEKRSLQELFPQSPVICFGDPWPSGACESVVMFCCALGPVNTKSRNESHRVTTALKHEIAGIRQILNAIEQSSVHLIFVSSVLAWSSSIDRFLYSGAKRLGESALRDMAVAHPACSFSVVYPGRLVEVRRWSGLLSTRYSHLASVMLRIASHIPQSRILGWDARLFLLRDWLRAAFRLFSKNHGLVHFSQDSEKTC